MQARVNDKSFELSNDGDGPIVDGEPLNWDVAEIGPRSFHIIRNGKSYNAEVIKADIPTKTFSIRINGRIYQVALKDRFDMLLEKMGMNNSGAGKINTVKAPMPGLIIDLKVKPGDKVKAGDALLILEAMKMENILKSPGEATVKSVNIKKGESVEKGQLLIEFS